MLSSVVNEQSREGERARAISLRSTVAMPHVVSLDAGP